MLEARLNEAGLLKKIIDAIKDVVSDCLFDFSDEGLKLQAMDSSHVSLCTLHLERDAFESFRCDKPLSLGISLSSFGKVLKCSRDNDTLTLKADDPKDVLHVMFENDSQDKIMDFTIKLMNLQEEALGIPDQDYMAKVEMPTAEFSKIIRDLSALGDTCSISCTKEGVKFSVQGEIGSAAITVRNSQPTADEKVKGTTLEISQPVDLTFALRYLKFFTQASPLSDRVSFGLASDVPLMVEYAIKPVKEDKDDETSSHNSKLQFYLAPKIDENTQA